MAHLLNARGDTASNMIVWFAAITAAIILAVWFMRNNPYGVMRAADALDEDLIGLRESMGNACNADTYFSRYNPRSKLGEIRFSDRSVCINQTDTGKTIGRCAQLPCNTGLDRIIGIEGTTYINIIKNSTWEITYE
jgi:hypothetical protein